MKRICTLLFVIFFIKISAQSEIKGIVFSDSGGPLARVNILLLNPKNEIETFGFSDKTGSFSVSAKYLGKYVLQVKTLNHNSVDIPIEIKNKNQITNLQKIILTRLKETEIKEVVITRKNPIQIKKDTIEFTVERFSNGSELTVEDILKKLPGLKIDGEGKIKIGNQEVERVMVENDDLFERGYQTLTKNMPSQSLEKVQVLKNYSKNKLLKGVENSEKIAINLTLKEDAKGKWFGNLLLASTSYKENMHQGKINIMNFSKRRKVYFLFNGNNIGLNEMKGVEYLIAPNSDQEVENVGHNLQTLSIVNLHQKNQQFGENRTNFNNDKLGSFSYVYNFISDWKLKLVTIYNETENRNYVNSIYNYHHDNINFTNIEGKAWKQSNNNIVGKLEVTKEFKNKSNLQIYSKISSLKENNNNEFTFNSLPNFQKGNNRLFASENKVVYTKKIDSSNAIVGVAKFIYQERPYNFIDENEVFQYITGNPNAQKINQTIDSRMQYGGIKLSYLKKYHDEHHLEVQVGDQYRKDILKSEINLLNENQDIISFNKNEFINDLELLQNSIFSEIKWTNKWKKWTANFNILSEYISSDFNQIKESGVYISPNFNISYENRKTGNFSLFGNRRFSPVSINNQMVNYIYQGDRNFLKSTFGFQILPDYGLGLSYNLGDQLSENLSMSFNYNRNEKYIANNMIVNPNYTFNQNILVKNSDNFFGNIEFRKYIKLIRSRISIVGNLLISNYENSINNQNLIRTKFSNYKIGFEMKSGWLKKINYELGYDWTFNDINSDINQNKYLDQKGFANLYYNFTKVFQLHANFEFYKFGNTLQKTTKFLDVKLDYRISKNKMNIFIRANNLLNSNSIQRFTITNVSESIYTQRLLPRHIILGINLNF